MTLARQAACGRVLIADHIERRLRADESQLRAEFSREDRIASFIVDDLLPHGMAMQIHRAFPSAERLLLKRSMREYKYIGVQMDQYDSLLEEAIFAFQDPRVVDVVGKITGVKGLQADPHLYAGGVSAMADGHFLSPHIDNSHDGEQSNYRALNLLFYVTPNWNMSNGGNLELWDRGMTKSPRVIESRFNRLVIMRTDPTALHSVSQVKGEASRCCVSNYYFSESSPTGKPYFNATAFRAWPGHPIRDAAFMADAKLRTILLSTVLKGRYKNPHIYKAK